MDWRTLAGESIHGGMQLLNSSIGHVLVRPRTVNIIASLQRAR